MSLFQFHFFFFSFPLTNSQTHKLTKQQNTEIGLEQLNNHINPHKLNGWGLKGIWVSLHSSDLVSVFPDLLQKTFQGISTGECYMLLGALDSLFHKEK